jgi:hypothetical protein
MCRNSDGTAGMPRGLRSEGYCIGNLCGSAPRVCLFAQGHSTGSFRKLKLQSYPSDRVEEVPLENCN